MPRVPLKTPWQVHRERWGKGCGARICETATKICLARGKLPCDIFFLGEAPGVSEDIIGLPFQGPAGHHLDLIITNSLGLINQHRAANGLRLLTYAMSNLVGCIPFEDVYDPDNSGAPKKKAGEPEMDDIECCSPRLVELIQLADPSLMICVGKLAEIWTDPALKFHIDFHKEIPRASIVHPAHILRNNIAQQNLSTKRCVATITQAIEKVFEGE